MIITFLRSSSYGAYDFCPQKFWISYTLGMREPSGRKATLGNMIHKGLECLARQKLATQKGETTFADDETGRVFPVDSFTPEQGIEFGYEYYSERETHHVWTLKDLKWCKKQMNDLLAMNGGRWNPLNREVVQPEQFFDFTIEEPWAKYSYKLPNGEKLDGYLGLKGTVDLITRIDADTLEYCDWKSGMRKDWATGKPKDWRALRDDPQMRMYHYALTRLYPDVKYFIMTIVFIQDGGAFPLDFGPNDIPKTKKMLQDRFDTIRECVCPARIINDPVHRWKCSKLCHYGKANFEDTNKTICQHLHEEVVALGMDRATAKYAKAGALSSYGQGGGSSNRDKPKDEP